MAKFITSRSNETIKLARSLQQAKVRRETGLHIAESDKLVQEVVQAGISIHTLFIVDGIDNPWPQLDEQTVYISPDIMASICEAKTPQRFCAIVNTPLSSPSAQIYNDGLVVALDTVQDSGNLGTIIRTADAFGSSAVLIGDGCADPFSAKSLRAGMGSTYHLPVLRCNLNEALKDYRENGFQCICGHLKGSETLDLHTAKVVLVIGNEGNGVSDDIAALCDLYRLPMYGKAESLNAAIAAGILIYRFSNILHE